MISIERDGTKVKVEINPNMGNKHVMVLHWETNHEWYAELLVQRLRDRMWNSLKDLRRSNYNEGWRDKASKKSAKKDWFSGGW